MSGAQRSWHSTTRSPRLATDMSPLTIVAAKYEQPARCDPDATGTINESVYYQQDLITRIAAALNQPGVVQSAFSPALSSKHPTTTPNEAFKRSLALFPTPPSWSPWRFLGPLKNQHHSFRRFPPFASTQLLRR